MKNWWETVKKSSNPKVLTMFSGGKDSAAALIMLKQKGIDVTAIHFTHKWGSSIPVNEVKRICSEYSIPLLLIDYTQEFCEAVKGYTGGRPCLLCKKQMYKCLLNSIRIDDFGWLCIGDNANDRTTLARMNKYIKEEHPEENVICSSYFGSEMGIVLHPGMKVLRPLIDMNTQEIEEFLNTHNISIQRMNSTGDKYFEYHREGCPIQFVDIGVELNEKLFEELHTYNEAITEFARHEGILASIHMPSTFIITIPRGYEEKAANYLKEKGLNVDTDCNSNEKVYANIYSAHVTQIQKRIFDTEAYKKIFSRMAERLEVYSETSEITVTGNNVICFLKTDMAILRIIFDFRHGIADVIYEFTDNTSTIKEKSIFDNLVLELFRTRKYSVLVDHNNK